LNGVRAIAAGAVAALLMAGCGTRGEPPLPRDVVPVGVGAGASYRPPSLGAAARQGRAVGRLRCTRARAERFGVHVELIVNGRVLLLPAGVGVAAPQRRRGAYVLSGRCSYPVRTREPTGVIELAPVVGGPVSLGELFAVWGQPLGPSRLAGFRGEVATWVNGVRHQGDPRSVVLDRHAVIVLEVGRRVPPHASYSFPPGL
jgi:hypothetical protein